MDCRDISLVFNEAVLRRAAPAAGRSNSRVSFLLDDRMALAVSMALPTLISLKPLLR